MIKYRLNDSVMVNTGKDKGKSGKIVKLAQDRAVVAGVNVVKKHLKPSKINPQGGIVDKEMPIAVSNLSLVCSNCSKPTRVGSKVAGENKVRICKKCKEVISYESEGKN